MQQSLMTKQFRYTKNTPQNYKGNVLQTNNQYYTKWGKDLEKTKVKIVHFDHYCLIQY